MALTHTTTPSSSTISLRPRLGAAGCEKPKERRYLRRANEYRGCILNNRLANRRSVPVCPIPSAIADQSPTYLSCMVTLAPSQAERFIGNNGVHFQTYHDYLPQKTAGINRSHTTISIIIISIADIPNEANSFLICATHIR